MLISFPNFEEVYSVLKIGMVETFKKVDACSTILTILFLTIFDMAKDTACFQNCV
jgi:hypothetical protein